MRDECHIMKLFWLLNVRQGCFSNEAAGSAQAFSRFLKDISFWPDSPSSWQESRLWNYMNHTVTMSETQSAWSWICSHSLLFLLVPFSSIEMFPVNHWYLHYYLSRSTWFLSARMADHSSSRDVRGYLSLLQFHPNPSHSSDPVDSADPETTIRGRRPRDHPPVLRSTGFWRIWEVFCAVSQKRTCCLHSTLLFARPNHDYTQSHGRFSSACPMKPTICSRLLEVPSAARPTMSMRQELRMPLFLPCHLKPSKSVQYQIPEAPGSTQYHISYNG